MLSLLFLSALPLVIGLEVNSGRLSKSDSILSTFTSESSSLAPITRLSVTDSLELTFFVTENAEAVQPKQVMVQWLPTDESERERKRDYLAVVKVRNSGKAIYNLELSRAPLALLSLSNTGKVSATLIIGNSGSAKPLKISLGDFIIDADLALPFPYPADNTLPTSWQVERYSLRPELSWAFRTPEKLVGGTKAIGGTIFVLAPWVALVSIVGHIKPSLASPTINIATFLACMVAFEALIVRYWTSLTLIESIPYFTIIALLTALTGRRALGDMRSRRLAREAIESGKKTQ